ncbi:MAG: chorismate-binding protein [Bacteroidia bacterium]|nr:chorismate-binding protein [Bacteroidia bacterium]
MDQVFFKLPGEDNIKHWTGHFSLQAEEIPSHSKEQVFIFGKFNEGTKAFLLYPEESKQNSFEQFTEIQLQISTSKHLRSEAEKNEADYIKLIAKAVNWQSKKSGNSKVVLARSETQSISINAIESFRRFCESFPKALVSLVVSKDHGCWLGASPEIFLKADSTGISTFSLAGTRKANENQQPWGTKEIREQQLVTQFIEDNLNRLMVDFKAKETETLRIGELEHILTRIEIETHQKNKLSEIIEALNPTPAVCGLPKQEAIQFIEEEEGLKREFYAGLIGPILTNNEIHLYVNLRCLSFDEKQIRQFAGGGITSESDPEKEWEETKNKMALTRKKLVLGS